MSRETRVLVLRGGPSTERAVSLVSGEAVAAACRRLGYLVTESDIGPNDLGTLDCPTDVVFPVLHGRFGEDGQLQAILDKRGIRYVGSDAAASRIAIDKNATKRAWRRIDLPTPAWATLDSAANLAADARGLWPPLVVKPIAEGSSIGVCICEETGSLHGTVANAVRTHGKVLIERRLVGPELTVGILNDAALPVIQVKPATAFYDYDAKYVRDDTSYLFEPEIDAETYRRSQEIALQAFAALGCRDLGRVDVIIDEEHGPQLLEINTMPGFTPHSLLPKAASYAGITFDQLIDRLVRMALDRQPATQRSEAPTQSL